MRAAAALGAHGPGLSPVALSTTEVSYKGTKGQSHKETKDSPISPESPWGRSWGLGTFLLRGRRGAAGLRGLFQLFGRADPSRRNPAVTGAFRPEAKSLQSLVL